MPASHDTVAILKMPEVKSYLISVFGMAKSPEQSYERLLSFFTRQSELEQKALLLDLQAPEHNLDAQTLVSAAGKALGIWDPDRLLSETEASIRNGLRRISVCQHRDGGWGYYWEQTSAWATAYALLALEAGQQLGIHPDRSQCERGYSWLTLNYEKWSLAHIPPRAWNSTYEPSLVARCFLTGGKNVPAVDLSLQEMLTRQNPDGGWNPAFPGNEVVDPQPLVSEVGATSMAIQAFAAAGQPYYLWSIESGLRWILKAQQADGCWIGGPSDNPLDNPGEPSLSKTCDALSGIAAARRAGIFQDFTNPISKAIGWVTGQEKFLPSSSGWGYDQVQEAGKSSDLVSTCLVLEAFVQTDAVALSVIAPYARMLMSKQSQHPGDLIDGAWQEGDTFRITLALIQFWTKLKASQTSAEAELAASIA